MPATTWTDCCGPSGAPGARFQLPQLPGLGATRQRLAGGLSEGVEVLVLENGPLRIRVLPTRGMGVWSMEYNERRIGWRSPVSGPVHPSLVNLAEPNGLGWLAGFDELLVRCGLQSNGAPDFSEGGELLHPLHGRIANQPAKRVDVAIDPETARLTVVGVIEEARLHGPKLRLTSSLTTRLGDTGFALHDRVENLSGTAADFQLLYHLNLGVPLLTPGSRIHAPVERLAPRDAAASRGVDPWDTVAAPQPGAAEEAYYARLHRDGRDWTEVLLHDADAATGVKLSYDTTKLPCFTLWKCNAAVEDGYVVGLEPATNFPNPHTFERRQGRVVELSPGGVHDCHLRVDYLPTPGGVAEVVASVRGIQGNQDSTCLDRPEPGWSVED